MKKTWLALTGASLLLLTACGQSTTDSTNSNNTNNTNTTTNQQVAGPEAIAKQNCSSCHGGDLQGNYGPNLQKIGSKYSKEQLVDIISNGTGSMPPQNQITAEHKEELATWLSEKK